MIYVWQVLTINKIKYAGVMRKYSVDQFLVRELSHRVRFRLAGLYGTKKGRDSDDPCPENVVLASKRKEKLFKYVNNLSKVNCKTVTKIYEFINNFFFLICYIALRAKIQIQVLF